MSRPVRQVSSSLDPFSREGLPKVFEGYDPLFKREGIDFYELSGELLECHENIQEIRGRANIAEQQKIKTDKERDLFYKETKLYNSGKAYDNYSSNPGFLGRLFGQKPDPRSYTVPPRRVILCGVKDGKVVMVLRATNEGSQRSDYNSPIRFHDGNIITGSSSASLPSDYHVTNISRVIREDESIRDWLYPNFDKLTQKYGNARIVPKPLVNGERDSDPVGNKQPFSQSLMNGSRSLLKDIDDEIKSISRERQDDHVEVQGRGRLPSPASMSASRIGANPSIRSLPPIRDQLDNKGQGELDDVVARLISSRSNSDASIQSSPPSLVSNTSNRTPDRPISAAGVGLFAPGLDDKDDEDEVIGAVRSRRSPVTGADSRITGGSSLSRRTPGSGGGAPVPAVDEEEPSDNAPRGLSDILTNLDSPAGVAFKRKVNSKAFLENNALIDLSQEISNKINVYLEITRGTGVSGSTPEQEKADLLEFLNSSEVKGVGHETFQYFAEVTKVVLEDDSSNIQNKRLNFMAGMQAAFDKLAGDSSSRNIDGYFKALKDIDEFAIDQDSFGENHDLTKKIKEKTDDSLKRVVRGTEAESSKDAQKEEEKVKDKEEDLLKRPEKNKTKEVLIIGLKAAITIGLLFAGPAGPLLAIGFLFISRNWGHGDPEKDKKEMEEFQEKLKQQVKGEAREKLVEQMKRLREEYNKKAEDKEGKDEKGKDEKGKDEKGKGKHRGDLVVHTEETIPLLSGEDAHNPEEDIPEEPMLMTEEKHKKWQKERQQQKHPQQQQHRQQEKFSPVVHSKTYMPVYATDLDLLNRPVDLDEVVLDEEDDAAGVGYRPPPQAPAPSSPPGRKEGIQV